MVRAALRHGRVTIEMRFGSLGARSSTQRLVVIAVTGEVDIASTGELRSALTDALIGGATTVIVDMSEATFIDAAGIGTLVGAVNVARQVGAWFRLREPSTPVSRLLDLLDMRALFALDT
jgi:anti-anti-sigma factor